MKLSNYSKCIFSLLLCVCVFFTAFASCSDEPEKQPAFPDDNGYHQLTQIFTDNTSATEMLQTVDSLLKGDKNPSEQAYTEALITAMVTYDKKHASQVAEQYKTDNLRLAKEKNMDLEAISAVVYSTMTSMDASTEVFRTELPVFFDNLSLVEPDPARWLYVLSNLEAMMQNYAKYHAFLQTIADNTTGSLQEAARTLQGSMQKVAGKVANAFAGDTETGFRSVSEFFFEEWLFSELFRRDEDYTTDNNLQMLLDTATIAITSIEATAATPLPGEDAWKKVYVECMMQYDVHGGKYTLLHINNDEIPEVYHDYSTNSILYSYNNGIVLSEYMGDLFYYMDGKNLFYSSSGRMDYYYDYIYSIENDELVIHHTGHSGYLDNSVDENGERIYDYYWDEQKVASEAEYEKVLNEAFPRIQATSPDDTYSYAEVIKAIICY